MLGAKFAIKKGYPMQSSESAIQLAEHLVAATLSAASAVDEDDWITAGQLLRRREQLLTQLERCSDLASARVMLQRVQEAELILLGKMEDCTRRALGELQAMNITNHARQAYKLADQGARLIERFG